MSEFTKGKWRIEKRDGHSDGVRPVITTMDVDRIAIISYRGVPSIEEAEANARLIAAAPALLEACEAVASWTMHSGKSEYDNCEPAEHYSHAYYLMEKEIFKARQIAKAAIAAGKNT